MPSQSSKTAFTGTANDYALYRPAYPDALLSHLRNAAGTTGQGVLVDLACGPGRVAIPMAAHFRHVVAIDVEPEMIALGKQRASRLGVTSIDWRVTPAEQLDLAPACAELVTIGEAFHRLDQKRILELASAWLIPDGCLATLGGESIWSGREPWKRIVVAVANRWTSIRLADPIAVEWHGHQDTLINAGWRAVEHQLCVDTVWTTETIVGFMRSTSFASHHALGDKAAQFEAELCRELRAFAPEDRFPACQRFGYTLATRQYM